MVVRDAKPWEVAVGICLIAAMMLGTLFLGFIAE